MKRTLILMRHAKSSWDSPSQTDHDRPLNERGYRSAKALGAWLREINLSPDEALVSSAVRTQETFTGLDLEIEPTLKDELYHSSSDTLLNTLSEASGEAVIIIAHNPGIGDLALRLARMMGDHPDHPRFMHYPTGATFVVEYQADSWADIDLSTGEIKDFIVPRDLL